VDTATCQITGREFPPGPYPFILLKLQAQRLLEIQQIQIELLEEVLKKSTPATLPAVTPADNLPA